MDDVMADTSERFYSVLRARYPDNPEFKVDRTHFHIKDEYTPESLNLVEAVLYSPEFQLAIPPVPRSLESVTEINNRGHHVIFCSTPHEVYETCVAQKYKWLEAKLGRTYARKLILTDDKTLIFGDRLIDDKPEIKGLITPSWEHVLFIRNYNCHVQGKRRMDWSNWREVLVEL